MNKWMNKWMYGASANFFVHICFNNSWRGSTLEVGIWNLTYKDGARTERIEMFLIALDP